jgi:hypothetical protein
MDEEKPWMQRELASKGSDNELKLCPCLGETGLGMRG